MGLHGFFEIGVQVQAGVVGNFGMRELFGNVPVKPKPHNDAAGAEGIGIQLVGIFFGDASLRQELVENLRRAGVADHGLCLEFPSVGGFDPCRFSIGKRYGFYPGAIAHLAAGIRDDLGQSV